MIKYLATFTLLLTFSALSICCTHKTPNAQLPMTTDAFSISFATADEAKALLVTEDAYVKAWSQFDIDSKSKKVGNTKAVYFEHIKKQALDWTEEDKAQISASLGRINAQMAAKGFKLKMATSVTMIKTTADEEGGATGYTRANFVVLSKAISSMKPTDIDHLMAHELFHVISRNKPELRKELYGLIGFEMMEPVEYPAAIKDYRITNPDATQTDSYIVLNVKGEDAPCMMILYANKPYEGGSFFQYLNVGFLRLDTETLQPVVDKEGPVIYSNSEVGNFFEQVGRNTNYIIHPEEIMADNFSYAVLGKENLSTPELVESIQKILQQEH